MLHIFFFLLKGQMLKKKWGPDVMCNYFKLCDHKSVFHILLDLFACFYSLKNVVNHLSSEEYVWPRARSRSHVHWACHWLPGLALV